MEDIEKLLDQDHFLKTLFNSIPLGVMLVDKDQKVQAVNDFMRQTFNVAEGTVVDRNIGEAIHCINSLSGTGVCALDKPCKCDHCKLKSISSSALSGQKISRTKSEIQLIVDGKAQNKDLLVTATPVNFGKEVYALVLLEDVTELSKLRKQLDSNQGITSIVGKNPKILDLKEKIKVLAEVDAPVFIEGESGTGKELVAKSIHAEGPRANAPFIVINCGAMPETLLESELFGHVKGSFTGAIRDKKGRFELANGGTLFLDEIGEISQGMQVKLLRVLQEGNFTPVGGETELQVDVRILSATNKDIKKEVQNGNFREDLYYRMCVVPLSIPPLRQRRDDIPMLANHILKLMSIAENGKAYEISPASMDILRSHSWPGNIRELQNIMQFAIVHCDGNIIEPEHILPGLQGHDALKNIPNKRTRSRKLNTKRVKDALRETNGNHLKAAGLLGVSRSTLYRFLDSVKD